MHDLSPLESGEPRTIAPKLPSDYFEVLTRAVFNAGLSWRVVHAHWPALADAFSDFDPEVVAGYDEQDVERLVADERLIQSAAKLAATTDNARTFMALVGEHDGFAGWVHSFADYESIDRALRKHFRYIGEFGAYWSLYTVGEPVPDYRAWAEQRGRSIPASLQ